MRSSRDRGEVWSTVEYYDGGPTTGGSITTALQALNRASLPSALCKNTGQSRRETFHLADASSASRQNGGAIFDVGRRLAGSAEHRSLGRYGVSRVGQLGAAARPDLAPPGARDVGQTTESRSGGRRRRPGIDSQPGPRSVVRRRSSHRGRAPLPYGLAPTAADVAGIRGFRAGAGSWPPSRAGSGLGRRGRCMVTVPRRNMP